MRPRASSLSRPGPGRAAPRSRAARAVLVLLVPLLGLLGAAPAAAHDALAGSEPADGATVGTADRVVLTFTADQLEVGAAVEVLAADGSAWTEGEPVVSGTVVEQALRPDLPAGPYTVTWRSVSSDGHPIAGQLSFTVTTGPEAVQETSEADAPVTPSPEPSDAAPAPGPTAAGGEPDADGPAAAPTVDPEDVVADASPLGWLLGGLAVLVVAAVAVTLVVRRRGGRS